MKRKREETARTIITLSTNGQPRERVARPPERAVPSPINASPPVARTNIIRVISPTSVAERQVKPHILAADSDSIADIFNLTERCRVVIWCERDNYTVYFIPAGYSHGYAAGPREFDPNIPQRGVGFITYMRNVLSASYDSMTIISGEPLRVHYKDGIVGTYTALPPDNKVVRWANATIDVFRIQ